MINVHSHEDKEIANLEKQIFINNAKAVLLPNGVENKYHQQAIAEALLALYSTKDRFYHTYVHINQLVENERRYLGVLTPSERLAILFHDAIYIPSQKDNEGRSVDLMVMLMAGFGVPLTEWCWASRCIKETANHLNNTPDASTHAVLDLDLTPFAVPYDDFMKQNLLIGREFPNVTSEQRATFMEKFLKKDRIYYKLHQLEESARQNIERYIKELRSGEANVR